jgi:hypothetical protein
MLIRVSPKKARHAESIRPFFGSRHSCQDTLQSKAFELGGVAGKFELFRLNKCHLKIGILVPDKGAPEFGAAGIHRYFK